MRASDAQHKIVSAAVDSLNQKGERLCYTSQNLVEFWSAATRPIVSANGFGLSVADADRSTKYIETTFFLLPDDPRVIVEWRRLVVQYGVSGRQVHDARLAAYMLVHGVTHILTFNTTDFARYAAEGIVAVHPASV